MKVICKGHNICNIKCPHSKVHEHSIENCENVVNVFDYCGCIDIRILRKEKLNKIKNG